MRPEDFPILLVEDDENDVLLLRRALQRARVLNPLTVIGNGEDAIAYLEQLLPETEGAEGLPALLLLDLKLPRKSGLEVLSWVRSRKFFNGMPVVILTSSREQSDLEQAYDLGANSYLVKPGGHDELVDVVRQVDGYWLILNESLAKRRMDG